MADEQSTGAAERSVSLRRGAEPVHHEPTCFVCGGAFRNGSYAARVLPPMVEVCSAACAANPRFAGRPFVARWGSGGEVMVTAPDGRVQFMGLWGFARFIWAALRAGKSIEVADG